MRAMRSILQKARHSLVCHAKNMSKRLSHDWFQQKSTQHAHHGVAFPPCSSEPSLSDHFVLAHEYRSLKPDQELLDLLDHILAENPQTPQALRDCALDCPAFIQSYLGCQSATQCEKSTLFFRHPFSKRGYF